MSERSIMLMAALDAIRESRYRDANAILDAIIAAIGKAD
jgi:hypothetical protein